jgi:hypothetical protein
VDRRLSIPRLNNIECFLERKLGRFCVLRFTPHTSVTIVTSWKDYIIARSKNIPDTPSSLLLYSKNAPGKTVGIRRIRNFGKVKSIFFQTIHNASAKTVVRHILPYFACNIAVPLPKANIRTSESSIKLDLHCSHYRSNVCQLYFVGYS